MTETCAAARSSAGRMNGGFLAGLALSLALLTGLVGWVGWREVAAAVSSVGGLGFAAFTLTWLGVMGVPGLAWAAAAGSLGQRPQVFVWARLLREAAADVLPFSQLGGLLVGSRVVIAAGVAEEVALGSTLVDLAAEIAAQALYTLIGGALILHAYAGDIAAPLLWSGVAGVSLLLAGFAAFVLGHGRAVAWLGRAAVRWAPDSGARAEAITAVARSSFADPGRMGLAIGLHLAGWIASAGASYLALRLMGLHVPLWAVIAVESLMYAVRNLGFALPVGLGVQEGAYVLLGPLFGIPPSFALALSLLRRARDVAIGVPALLAWQACEGRLAWRLRRQASGETSSRV